MLDKLLLYYHTVKFLKWKQIRYRLFYFIKNRIFRRKIKHHQINSGISALKLQPIPSSKIVYFGNQEFEFLNINKKFKKNIDWDFNEFGKLWTYNLNYFNFLNQENICPEDAKYLITKFASNINNNLNGLEPYPLSLRIKNWVIYASVHQIDISEFDNVLFSQTLLLKKNIEYHLLGNHLLENGFALIFASYYFRNKDLYLTAKILLEEELKEQILDDGGHFELSPMYHKILFKGVLDIYNLISNNTIFYDEKFLYFINNISVKMMSWLRNVTFSNGETALFNDCANNISLTFRELEGYSISLGIDEISLNLSDSGYRMHKCSKYEILVDVGEIGPSYQPGHGHCDISNFSLVCNNHFVIVDTGTSTYENNERRNIERSSISHNVITLSGFEQSEVWGSFRVGRKAKVKLLSDTDALVKVEYKPFSFKCTQIQREFYFESEELIITDTIEGNKDIPAQLNFHFYPGVNINIYDNVLTTDYFSLEFNNAENIDVENYFFAPEFNTLIEAQKVVVNFKNRVESIFRF